MAVRRSCVATEVTHYPLHKDTTAAEEKQNDQQHEQQHGKDYSKAWDILQAPGKVKDMDALTHFLSKLGIEKAEDLEVLEEAELKQLGSFLKLVGQRAFNAAVHV